jgi:hypothetical protein
MEPEWTRLPLSASFVPFVDYLINRIAAEESWIVKASPGEVVELPASVRAMVGTGSDGIIAVSSDRRVLAPPQIGVYFLRDASGDTVGALEVNADVRESQLQVASDNQLRTAFGDDSHILDSDELRSSLFGGIGIVNLAGLCLLIALAAAVGEFLVASGGGRTRTAA